MYQLEMTKTIPLIQNLGSKAKGRERNRYIQVPFHQPPSHLLGLQQPGHLCLSNSAIMDSTVVAHLANLFPGSWTQNGLLRNSPSISRTQLDESTSFHGGELELGRLVYCQVNDSMTKCGKQGMKMTIDAAFEKIEGVLSLHVAAGHYDLSLTPATMEEEVVIVSDDPSIAAPKTNPAVTRAQLPRPLIVHPDFWEDLICPGMAVSMAMWPMEAFIAPNLRGTRPTTTQAGRGMGVGNQAFNNIVNVGPPPPPPPGFINIVPPGGRHARRKAKTRVNPGRPVAK